jgi:thioredoxin reductase (NADPH)
MAHEKLIIIGSGPAGLTAGIYAARANLKPIIIEGAEPGGQLMSTSIVENWPGEISIKGPELMMNMRKQAEHQGARFISGSAQSVNFKKKPFSITTTRKETFTSDAVIIASGAEPKRLHCPGEEKYWAKGVSTCAVCDGTFFKDVPVIIVGGGDTAMEYASFMSNLTDDITIIHILDKLTASHAMQKPVLKNPKIKIIYESTVTEIKGDGQKVTSAIITNQKTNEQQELKTDAVFLAIGFRPNTDFLQGQVELNKFNYLVVNNHTRTSIEGVFGAGDVEDYRYRQAVTAAGAGCMAALDAERWLSRQ